MNEAIKTRAYKLTLNGKTMHHRIELLQSNAFQYGNGTAVVHYTGSEDLPIVYDTRYEVGIVKNFDQWADNYIKEWANPKCVIEVE